jgi:hypothetical protein
VTEDQVTEANAHAKSQALDREMNRDASAHALAGGCADGH